MLPGRRGRDSGGQVVTRKRSAVSETFQITPEQAQAYEELFVPALFAQWAPMMVDLADLREGQRVLDVACGTGVAARAAADRVGGSGAVVGVDLNPAMLEVARRVRPDIEWRQGDVCGAALPRRELRRRCVSVGVVLLPRPGPGPRGDGSGGATGRCGRDPDLRGAGGPGGLSGSSTPSSGGSRRARPSTCSTRTGRRGICPS